MRKTKIVCTLGPATDREGVLRQTFWFNRKVTGFARDSPFEERLPPAGGRCRVATKGGVA